MIVWLGLVILAFSAAIAAAVIALRNHDEFCKAKFSHEEGTVERKTWWTLLGT